MVNFPFEWDEAKNKANLEKHEVDFRTASEAFEDPQRIIIEDAGHSEFEKRFYCIGRAGDGIVTVRFTYRTGYVRIFGAGYWRQGKKYYEKRRGL